MTTKLLTIARLREATRLGIHRESFGECMNAARRLARVNRPEDAAASAAEALECYRKFPELYPDMTDKVLKRAQTIADTGIDPR